MPQTTMNVTPQVGQSGQLANTQAYEAVTKTNGQSGNIAPGLFVVRGTDADNEAIVPAATTDITGAKALGFAMFQDTYIDPTAQSNTERASYRQYAAMPVVRKGTMWIRCETAFTAGAKVFVRFTANGAGKVPGNIRNDADTDKAVALPNARFENTGAADELALVRFDVWPTGT